MSPDEAYAAFKASVEASIKTNRRAHRKAIAAYCLVQQERFRPAPTSETVRQER